MPGTGLETLKVLIVEDNQHMRILLRSLLGSAGMHDVQEAGDGSAALNVLATVVFAALVGLTLRRGTTDPVCGMKVDRGRSLALEVDGHTHHFCSDQCRQSFAASEVTVLAAGNSHAPLRLGRPCASWQ